MSHETPKYCFGPVLSRRLGRSLGVDLTPFKTCTYDCVYCQLGRTTRKTIERAEYVPLEGVLDELRVLLASGAEIDYITLAGSGEPTLYARLDEFVAGVKAMTRVPLAVLTNGSLFWMPEVRAALRDADLVVPSLDAGDPAMFEQVNRPEPTLTFERMVEGLLAFREEFTHQLWLEVFLNAGVTKAQVEALAALARRIRPDRVQINTAVRPPAESDVRPLSADALLTYAALFGEGAEVIADIEAIPGRCAPDATAADVLNMIRRHPCSAKGAADGLGISEARAEQFVRELLDDGLIEPHERDDAVYYRATSA